MNASAVMVFLFFALVLTLWNGVHLLRPPAAGIVRVPDNLKGGLAVGVVMLLAGGGVISVLHPTREQIEAALGIFAIMLSGVVAKWVWDATLRYPPFVLDGIALIGALVVTPLVALAIWNQLTGAQTLQTLLLCFSHGFFWQTIFSDISKRAEQNHGQKLSAGQDPPHDKKDPPNPA